MADILYLIPLAGSKTTTAFPESSVIDMKRIISIFLSIVILSLSLMSCSAKIVKMEFSENSTLVAEDGTVYKYAPVGYEPTEQGEEYGLIEGIMEEKLYKIGDMDPTLWLTTEYSGAATTVYYSESIELPSVEELSPRLCYICEQGEKAYSIYTLGSSEGEDSVIKELISAICDEEAEPEIWPRSDADETYMLKFYSEKWPAIYYNLVYAKCESGGYIYDRASKKCVAIGDILNGYIENGK